jgi:hypothetical protein
LRASVSAGYSRGRFVVRATVPRIDQVGTSKPPSKRRPRSSCRSELHPPRPELEWHYSPRRPMRSSRVTVSALARECRAPQPSRAGTIFGSLPVVGMLFAMCEAGRWRGSDAAYGSAAKCPATTRWFNSRRERPRKNLPCARRPRCCDSHRIRQWPPCQRTFVRFQRRQGDEGPTR